MVNTDIGNQINSIYGPEYHDIEGKDMLQISDVVDGIMFVINNGDTSCTCELTLQPQKQAVISLTQYVDKRPFKITQAVNPAKKVALITGASKGIGRYIAGRMASHGYDLALVARSPGPLEELAEECRAFGVKVEVFPVDLTNMEAMEKAVSDCVTKLGNLNVLINNAGVNRRRNTLTAKGEFWDQIIDTNFRSAIQITRTALPYICQNKEGARAVIYISSSGNYFIFFYLKIKLILYLHFF